MKRVDFYLIAKNLSTHQFACRLINKAFNSGLTVRVELDTPEQARQLDALLWEYQSDTFIPHDLGAPTSGAVPSVLISDLPRLAKPADMLLNLRSSTPEPEQGRAYQRIAEIVPDNPEEREQMRNHFRHYRTLGCTPGYHPIS
ncbi:MAG: DNA polymerase III subunit chi [Pseudomonadales bacterium]|nr:DNA polymerase III subunit chi [Pseudomonadales bacterium]